MLWLLLGHVPLICSHALNSFPFLRAQHHGRM